MLPNEQEIALAIKKIAELAVEIRDFGFSRQCSDILEAVDYVEKVMATNIGSRLIDEYLKITEEIL